MAQVRDEGVAAPPDDGGNQGSFTRPQDELEIDPIDRGPYPQSAQDAAGPSGRGNSIFFFGAIAGFAAILFFFMYVLRAC
jgi:hypothetical protein